MSMYRVSADVAEKEKVVGGLLTAAQGGWLALGMVIFMLLTFLFSKLISPIPAMVLGLLVGGGIGIPLAFIKVRNMSLTAYIRLRWRFNKQSKQMINTLQYGQGNKKEA